MADEKPNPEVLSQVLSLLKVDRVVCIDDEYETDDSGYLEHLIGEIDATITDCTAAAFEEAVPSLPVTLDRSVWTERLRGQWDDLDASQRRDLGRTILAALGKEAPADLGHPTSLKEFLGDARLVEVTPLEWEQRSEEFLQLGTPEARVLLLFDQDLRYSGKSAEGGIDLIKDVTDRVGSEGETTVYCALLSSTFSKEAEESEWRGLADRHELELRKVLPISKDRLDTRQELAEGIVLAAINLGQEQMKDAVKRISEASLRAAMGELRNVSVWDFNHIVLSSSFAEGTWEPYTLFRLLALFERKSRDESALSAEWRAGFDRWVQLMRSLRKYADPKKSRVGSRVRELRHSELFAGSEINAWFAPLELGDVFLASEGKYFVLLAQPCFLALRQDGKREVQHGRLINIKKRPSTAQCAHCERQIPIPRSADELLYYPECEYFSENTDERWCFDLKRGFDVSLDVLDLATFRADGACKYSADAEPPTLAFGPSKARWADLRNEFVALTEMVETTVNGMQKGEVESVRIKQVELRMLHGYGTAPTKKKPSLTNREIDFGLSRVMRLNFDTAAEALVKMASVMARMAFDHDFALVREEESA